MGFCIYAVPSLLAVVSIKLGLHSSVRSGTLVRADDTLVPGKTDMTDTLVTTRNFKPVLRRDTESLQLGLAEAATASYAMLSRVTAATLVRWSPVNILLLSNFDSNFNKLCNDSNISRSASVQLMVWCRQATSYASLKVNTLHTEIYWGNVNT